VLYSGKWRCEDSENGQEPIEQTCRAGRTRRVNPDAANYAVQCVTLPSFCAARAGGAMNSGPTGSVTDARTMSPIFFNEFRSNFQPPAPATAANCSGRRAPQRATVTNG